MKHEIQDFDVIEVTPGMSLRKVTLYVGAALAFGAINGDLADGSRDFNGKGVPQVIQAITSVSSADSTVIVMNPGAGKDFEVIREERSADKKPLINYPSSIVHG